MSNTHWTIWLSLCHFVQTLKEIAMGPVEEGWIAYSSPVVVLAVCRIFSSGIWLLFQPVDFNLQNLDKSWTGQEVVWLFSGVFPFSLLALLEFFCLYKLRSILVGCSLFCAQRHVLLTVSMVQTPLASALTLLVMMIMSCGFCWLSFQIPSSLLFLTDSDYWSCGLSCHRGGHHWPWWCSTPP